MSGEREETTQNESERREETAERDKRRQTKGRHRRNSCIGDWREEGEVEREETVSEAREGTPNEQAAERHT